ncbi:hypothetical protein OROMI_031225 [Orobanche minor]
MKEMDQKLLQGRKFHRSQPRSREALFSKFANTAYVLIQELQQVCEFCRAGSFHVKHRLIRSTSCWLANAPNLWNRIRHAIPSSCNSVAAFPNPSRTKNPFDIGDDGFQAPRAMFPSMSLLQGALPNMPASTALVSHASAYARPLPSHMSPYGMNMTQVSGAYMGQLSNNMPLNRPQGNANLAKSEDAFASLNPIQLTSGINSSSDSSSSRTGNPFG